jgi:predicted permease
MEALVRDLRYAVRSLAARPGFTLVAVLSLALGIGANTAVFTTVKAIFLRPLPVADPSRLVFLYTRVAGLDGSLPVSYPNFRDFRDLATSFSDLSAVVPVEVSLTTGKQPELVQGEMVSGSYFRMLGVRAERGRTFLPTEDAAPGSGPVVVLGDELWRRRFGGDPQIVGKVVSLNGHAYTVVGVAPHGFTGTSSLITSRFWIPLSMYQQALYYRMRGFFDQRRVTTLGVVGRLKDGVTLERARSEMTGLAAHLAQEYPEADRGRSVTLFPLLETLVHPDQRELYVHAGALLATMVGLVLLIACLNVANMLLVRAAGRRREIAVRLALGAGRRRLMRQLLTESLVLSLLAGAVGLLFAVWAQHLVASFQIPFLPPSLDFSLDLRVLGFTLLLSLLTGLLFGFVPALQASRPNLVSALKEGVDAGAGRPGRRLVLRQLLIVVQVSLSLVALIAASLFLLSLARAERIRPGFDTAHLLSATFDLDNLGYDEAHGRELLQRLAERAGTLPGARSAAVAENLALRDRGLYRTATIQGREATDQPLIAQTNSVGVGYFDTLGIPILHGRAFLPEDTSGHKAVVVVNASFAEQAWPGQDPIGRRISLKPTDEVFEVVGVAADAKVNSLGEEPSPYLYTALLQAYSPSVVLLVRTTGDPARLSGPLRGLVLAAAPGLPSPTLQTLDDVIGALLWAPRAGAVLLSIFGLVALLLALIGIYGVTSYLVTQRRREIGIRLALGAQRADVLRLFLQRGMAVVAVGLAAGLLTATALARLVSSLLFGVGGRDPVAYGSAALALALVSLIANYIPALRAAAVPPVEVIRQP